MDRSGDDVTTVWDDDRFRAIDDSVSNLLRQLALAVAAMFIAFAGVWFVGGRLFGTSRDASAFIGDGALFTVFGCVMIFITSARPIRKAITQQRTAIQLGEERLRREADRHRFASSVQDALEMGEDESQALDVVARAFADISGRPAELLVADSSRAHLRQAAVSACGGGAGCGVTTPWGCPAVRRGQTLRFESSEDLAACPQLRQRGRSTSAVCVPVTVLGTPMGVIHTTAEPGQLPPADQIVQLESLAQQAGSRLGVLRAIASSQLAASTDPLTGCANRRLLEHRLRALREAGESYSIVLADLDHFKRLNDTHGHETGDRALRLFADVLRASVRSEDLVVRYGGEEFVLLLPRIDRTQATDIVDRARFAFTRALDSGEVPRFTASFGIADSGLGESAELVIRLADLAMFEAKQAGRDCVVVSNRSGDEIAVDAPLSN